MDIIAIHDARSFAELPGALFADEASVEAHRHFAARYEAACDQYALGRDELTFRDALSGLGFDNTEIEKHVRRPGHRGRALYI
jgi:hypothetical protein